MASDDSGSYLDFGFGFNDINFSDRVLRIEIEQDDVDEGGCGIEMKTIHISSIILAAKSPFFLKLFSNGMKESEECHATLKIHSSEEVAMMDLLHFMYTNKLSSSTSSSLLDLLMVADKFQVSACMTYCTKLLSNLPMTCELAFQFFHLPSSVFMAEEVQRLVDVAKKYLVDRYKDFSKFEEELLKLPIAGIEVVLSSDDLKVSSEDDMYDFVLKWTTKHYPIIEERRAILTTRLGSLIRFEYMTYAKLKEITSSNDFDLAYASKVVLEALFFKAQYPHLQTIPQFVERAYKYQPIKLLESKFPHPYCVVYLDLKKKECENLLPSDQVSSEDFHLGGKMFYLVAMRCTKGDNGVSSDSFGFGLGMRGKLSDSCSVAFEFSARSKPTEDFLQHQPKLTTMLTGGGKNTGYRNLFKVSWSQFIAEDSVYFINRVLYLKIDINMST